MSQQLKAIIVDDEEDGRLVLTANLSLYCPQVEIVASCNSAEEGVQILQSQPIDLVFLDIQMPKEDGFAMLERVKDKDFNLIFVTAHHDYAVQAIRCAALDYLLKPIDHEELVAAVQRAENKANSAERRQHFIDNVGKEEITQVVLPLREGYMFVQVTDILRCEADSNYTMLHLVSGEKHLVSKTLKEFEIQLSGNRFFRIHKSHLINMRYLKKYTRGDGGTVTMIDNTQLDVSRRNKEEFLKVFNL